MTSALDLGRIIRRDALLERLHRLRPHLVALIAPAGFGKSTFARQFVERSESFAICECAHVTDDLDFARRILPALAEENPERGAALSQRELLLGDGAMSSSERVALALNAWRRPSCPSTFVFEDAEHIADVASARELFTRLLAERPEGRTVVICSREGLRVHLSRFAAPHRIVTLRGDDLAFSRLELEQIFEPLDLNSSMLDRIYDISKGWPVPVLFIARLAAEGRHEILLDRLGDVAFEELYEYLADQVLATLPPFLTSALFAAAAIPNANAADLTLATGDPNANESLAAFARTSPFLDETPSATYVVHPLMRAMLIEGAALQRNALLASTAGAYNERGDHLRAAELHLARSNPEAAAKSLEFVAVGEDRAPSMRYARVLSSLDRSIVRRYPTLWSCSALLQTFSTESRQLLEETGTLWATLPADTPVNKRYYVLATRALLLTYLGMFPAALALLDAVAPRASIPDPPTTREHGYALYLHATVAARLGRPDVAERDLDLAWPFIESMDVMASAALMICGAEIARPRGDRIGESELLARSLDYARRSQLSNFVAFRLAEMTFGAWFAGDADTYAQSGAELLATVEGDGIRGFRFFACCARGATDGQPAGADLVRWILCGHLVAACAVPDDAAAARHARAARAAGVEYPAPFLQTLAAIVAAEIGPLGERHAGYDDARAFAKAAGSTPLVAAVDAMAEDALDVGMLHQLRARLRAREGRRPARITVSLLAGTVQRDGDDIKLADRELELLCAVARHREPVSRQELTEMLWPDRDDDMTRNALKVHLHRLRQHLGDETAIVRIHDGLRLSEDVDVDLWEIERTVGARHEREITSAADRAAVAAIYERLKLADRPQTHSWEWYAPIDRRIRELRCDFARQLAHDALANGRGEDALRLADEMIAYDACDEAAREIAIVTFLAQGDRAGALRHYRQYKDVLFAELQCAPSPSLTALLQT